MCHEHTGYIILVLSFIRGLVISFFNSIINMLAIADTREKLMRFLKERFLRLVLIAWSLYICFQIMSIVFLIVTFVNNESTTNGMHLYPFSNNHCQKSLWSVWRCSPLTNLASLRLTLFSDYDNIRQTDNNPKVLASI